MAWARCHRPRKVNFILHMWWEERVVYRSLDVLFSASCLPGLHFTDLLNREVHKNSIARAPFVVRTGFLWGTLRKISGKDAGGRRREEEGFQSLGR